MLSVVCIIIVDEQTECRFTHLQGSDRQYEKDDLNQKVEMTEIFYHHEKGQNRKYQECQEFTPDITESVDHNIFC